MGWIFLLSFLVSCCACYKAIELPVSTAVNRATHQTEFTFHNEFVGGLLLWRGHSYKFVIDQKMGHPLCFSLPHINNNCATHGHITFTVPRDLPSANQTFYSGVDKTIHGEIVVTDLEPEYLHLLAEEHDLPKIQTQGWGWQQKYAAGLEAGATIPPYDRGDQGSFRVTCHHSHILSDDPIVHPGQPGRSHSHTFFGNAKTNAATTKDNIRTITTKSTCQGKNINLSGYWMPTVAYKKNGVWKPLADASDGLNHNNFYYKRPFGLNNRLGINMVEPPDGLRFISGDSGATSAQEKKVVTWACESWTITSDASFSSKIPFCGIGDSVVLHIFFPFCWNGQLDSPNHKDHIVWPVRNACPSTHPKVIPQISFKPRWAVTSANYPSDQWKLASDGGAGGFSAHADYMMGWDQEVRKLWLENCINKQRHCSSGDLGNGWRMRNWDAGEPLPSSVPIGGGSSGGGSPPPPPPPPPPPGGDIRLVLPNSGACNVNSCWYKYVNWFSANWKKQSWNVDGRPLYKFDDQWKVAYLRYISKWGFWAIVDQPSQVWTFKAQLLTNQYDPCKSTAWRVPANNKWEQMNKQDWDAGSWNYYTVAAHCA